MTSDTRGVYPSGAASTLVATGPFAPAPIGVDPAAMTTTPQPPAGTASDAVVVGAGHNGLVAPSGSPTPGGT